MNNIQQVTPMLNVADFAATLDFFTRILGFKEFTEYSYDKVYAYLEREGAGVRILAEAGRRIIQPEDSRTTIYFDVRNVDELYADLKPMLDTLSPNDVVPPTDQPWKQRELLVRIPHGDWIAFGHLLQQ